MPSLATVPAYLADVVDGGHHLSVVVNYIREAQIAAGVPRAEVYDRTMLILAGMLVLGFICNLLVRPVAEKWLMKPEQATKAAAEQVVAYEPTGTFKIGMGGFDAKAVLA